MHYVVDLTWKPGTQAGVSAAEGRPDVDVSAPAELGGDGALWSPEHLLVASLQTCLMLTALYFIKRLNVTMLSYHSQTTGTMVKSPEGLRFTALQVAVNATVRAAADEAGLRQALEQAKKFCPVSAALSVPVTVSLTVLVAP